MADQGPSEHLIDFTTAGSIAEIAGTKTAAVPPCPKCQCIHVRVPLVTSFERYYRCRGCDHGWSVPLTEATVPPVPERKRSASVLKLVR